MLDQKPTEVPAASSPGDICLACGLCCTGALYASVGLEPEEVELAERLRLPVVEYAPGETAMVQPARCHVGGRCSIYEQRFAMCRKYTCDLLKRVEQGRESVAQALRVVAQVKGLVERIDRKLGAHAASQGLWERIRTFLEAEEAGTPEEQAAHAATRLEIGMLSLMCERHFDPRFRDHWRTGRQASPREATPNEA